MSLRKLKIDAIKKKITWYKAQLDIVYYYLNKPSLSNFSDWLNKKEYFVKAIEYSEGKLKRLEEEDYEETRKVVDDPTSE